MPGGPTVLRDVTGYESLGHHCTTRVAVEVAGTGVVEAVQGVKGVRQVGDTIDPQTGRLLLNVTADSTADVRPAIFDLAKAHDWTLYELHQETRSLEDLFRELTSGTGSEK